MKTDEDFNILLIKLIFCNNNILYKQYINMLKKTKTIKNLISNTLNKINLYKKINLVLVNESSFNINIYDPDMLDIYLNIMDNNIDQIMIPIGLNNINNEPTHAILFPDNEEIKL